MNKTGYKSVQALASMGKWQELESALTSMTGPDSPHDPDLALLKAECALRLQRPHETVSIATGILIGKDPLSTPLRARALLLRASASRLRGYIKAALEDAHAAVALLQDPSESPELKVEGSRQLGLTYGAMGDLDQAIQHLDEGLELCARSGDLGLSASIHHNLGTAFAHLGRLAEAQVHFNHARSCYEKIENRLELSEVLNNLAQSYADMGLFDQALTYFHQGLDLAREHNYRRIEAIALMGIGDALKEKGRFDEALEHYRSSFDPARDALEPRLLCYANMGIGNVYMSVGRRNQARTHLLQANYEAKRLGLKYELGLIVLAQGFLDAADKNLDRARTKLQESISILEGAGAVREVVKARLGLANVLHQLRSWPELDQALLDLATLVRRLDLQELLCLEGRRVIDVMKYAAKRQIGEGLYVEVYATLRESHERDIEASDHAVASPRLTPAFPKMEVLSLGDAMVTVDGERVTQADWESQKAKELFFFLLCHRQGRRREELLEVLWPELSPSLSRNAFYNNVYRARKALFKECLIQEGGVYKINPKGSLKFDLDEFKLLVEQADKLPRRSPERAALLTKAVQLYRGSFLKEFYSEWAETIRNDTEIQYLRALSQLAGFHTGEGNFTEAAAVLEKALNYDRTDVEAHEELIKLCFLAGDRSEALRRYRFYSDVSHKELGVKPQKSLEQLRVEATSKN